jgi:hydrogenase maturation factor
MKKTTRPILQKRIPDTDQELVVRVCDHGIWIVVHQGLPIQSCEHHLTKDKHRYFTMSWTNRTSAQHQAQKLNELFQTQEFEIAHIPGKTPE